MFYFMFHSHLTVVIVSVIMIFRPSFRPVMPASPPVYLTDRIIDSEFVETVNRRDWCARWGDYCVPRSRVRFATCCSGLRCVCGSLWRSGKCQCKTPSVFGR